MAELLPGTHFADYQIEGLAGRGGMGVVYRAVQRSPRRPVALKVVAPELAGDANFRTRFEREIEVAAAIEHPNVIPIYGAGEVGDQFFIAMRFVEGSDLRTVIERQGRLDAEDAVRFVRQIGKALDEAHRRGLVHRDVKPGNMLLAHGGDHVYLTDFGLTKRIASGSALTRTGEVVGTVDYLSPEQIEGMEADARVDVYALGCVLYHLLTGEVPFPRDTEVARMYAHLHHPPPRPSALVPGAPPGLDDVVARAMAKQPDDRYPSAGDLGRAAEAALVGASPVAERSVASGEAAPVDDRARTVRQAGDITSEATRPGPSAPRPERTQEPRARGGGRRLAVLSAALATLVAGGALAAVLAGDDDNGDGRVREPTVTRISNVGDGPDGVTVPSGGEEVYVTLADQGAVRRIDPSLNETTGEATPVGRNPDSIAVAGDDAWVTISGDGMLRRLQIGGGAIAPGREVYLGRRPEGLALGPKVVWVATFGADLVVPVHRETNRRLQGVGVRRGPRDVEVGSDWVWVTNSAARSVTRLDRREPQRQETFLLDGQPHAVEIAAGSVWVSDPALNRVVRLDPATGDVEQEIERLRDPRELAYGFRSIWVVNTSFDDVTRISARTGRIIDQSIPVGKHPIGVAVGHGSVWVANYEDRSVSRITP
jgi:DNA-binding beta-propeller fold protein YncE